MHAEGGGDHQLDRGEGVDPHGALGGGADEADAAAVRA